MKRAYKFRIYPDKNQEVKMLSILNTCRHLYNDALAERKRQAELNRLRRDFQVFPWGKTEWISYEDQANDLADDKNHFQKEVHSQVLQNVLKRLNRSFENLFNGFGYPRFKSRNRYDSFTYPQMGFKLNENKLTISKIGTMRIILHREIEGKIKTCTIKRDVDHWYAIFTVEIEKQKEPVEMKTRTGCDAGLYTLMTMSNGDKIPPPKYLRKSEKLLTRKHRVLSRKKLGSNNRKRQVLKVARQHRKIRNQRKDFAHKESLKLVKSYDLIIFEDLKILNMVRNHQFAKSIMDAAWGQFQTFTAYKAEEAGKYVMFVNPYKTSQRCSKCGHEEHLTLKDRVFKCSNCGNVQDRDTNSANEIESIGLRAFMELKNRHGQAELTPVESIPRGTL